MSLTQTDYEIKRAGFREILEASELVIEFHNTLTSEVARRIYKGSTVGFISSWKEWIEQSDHCFFVAYDGNKVIGAIGGLISEQAIKQEQYGYETFWFVKKAYRGSGIGMKLVQSFEHWLKSNGVKIMVLSSISEGTPKSRERFCEKMHFTVFETLMLKEI